MNTVNTKVVVRSTLLLLLFRLPLLFATYRYIIHWLCGCRCEGEGVRGAGDLALLCNAANNVNSMNANINLLLAY